MQNAESLSQGQIQQFLESSGEIDFVGQGRGDVYAWVQQVLVPQEFARMRKKERGRVRAYLEKITGRSAAQVTRLIWKYLDGGTVTVKPYRRRRFATKYTEQDVVLLAAVDRAHECLSGPATKRILQRECEQFSKQEYARLAQLSVAHLYNLRRSVRYRKHAGAFEQTRPQAVLIGERRKPEPRNRPGFLRVDTVHQGDWDGAKGVYHINAVDTVTQWRVVGCVSKIGEQYLVPVWKRSCISFRSRFWVFIQTMAPNSSITQWRGCWRNCASSSPRAVRTERRTMRWWKARTARLCASISATATSLRSMPKRCKSSTRRISIPT